ncbi:hypothetical protein AAG570_013250 [Ranatra chinensis]|uniref:CCHC-type domain-containing protein n=1 Tax=Ranatra chinensis TaxID=642074 RepID=A0ABD0YUS4_9HEMI
MKLDEAVDKVREEDEDFLENRKTEDGRTRVGNQRTRREETRREYRERREYKPQASKPRWSPREEPRTREQKRHYREQQDTRRCFQCKERGHIARVCPYMRRQSNWRNGPEPMEVNMTDLIRQYDGRRRRYVWLEKKEKTDSSEDEQMETSSEGETAIDKARRPQKRKKSTYAEQVSKNKAASDLEIGKGHEVPKKLDKTGIQKYTVVVDYRELNKRTKSEKYPLPRLEEMIDRMAGSQIFSVIDLKSGYHQIEMESGDIEKTSFQFERAEEEVKGFPASCWAPDPSCSAAEYATGTDTTAVAYVVGFLEEIVKETVQMELPDKLRENVRTLNEIASFDVVREDQRARSDVEAIERGNERIGRTSPPPAPPSQHPQRKTNGGGQRRECLQGWTNGIWQH